MRSRQLQSCDSEGSSAAPHHHYFPLHPSQARPQLKSCSSHDPLGVPSPPLTPEDPPCSSETKSHYVEPGPYGFYPKSTSDEARRRIMRPSCSTPSPPTRPEFTFPALVNTEFTFRTSPRPKVTLSFSPPPQPQPQSWKRPRPLADVDGEHSCLHKKKRRLRLFLITSRLSPQFSHPATNIVDRGSSRIAVWAKQRALGRNILRKAAILNRIRRQSISALETAGGLGRVLVEQEKEQEQFQLARLTLMYGSHDSATRPVSKMCGIGLPDVVETRSGEQINSGRSSPANSTGSPSQPLHARDENDVDEYRSPNDAYAHSHVYATSPRPSYLPMPPSPLGLSNYDALDLEDEILDPYAHLDEEYDEEFQAEHDAENDWSTI